MDGGEMDRKTLADSELALEQTVVGALLSDPSRMGSWDLTVDDFKHPAHCAIFNILQELEQQGTEPSVTVLSSMLAHVEFEKGLAAPDYMALLRRHAAIHLTDNIHRTLKRQSALISMEGVGHRLVESHISGDDPVEAITEALDQLSSIASGVAIRRTRWTFEAAAAALNEQMTEGILPEFIPTGIKALDDVTRGWRRGDFAIIAGRPSMGKSMLLQSASLRSARRGANVLFFSLEMSHEECMARAATDLGYTETCITAYADVLGGDLTDQQREVIGQALAANQTLPFVIEDGRGLSVAQMAAIVRREKRRLDNEGKTLDLVLVDHLGKAKASGRYRGDKVNETGEVSSDLHNLAGNEGVPVVAACQLSRRTEQRDDKRPSLADLRNSGDLEQDAHTVGLVFREAYYLERNKAKPGSEEEQEQLARLDVMKNRMELIVAKNRNGPVKSIDLWCHPPSNAVRGLARD